MTPVDPGCCGVDVQQSSHFAVGHTTQVAQNHHLPQVRGELGERLLIIPTDRNSAINWLLHTGIPDKRRIQIRIDRAEDGNFGDCAPVGEGVSEMRIHCGPGYRVYFTQRGIEVVILLAGGDKTTQSRDIKTALEIARQL